MANLLYLEHSFNLSDEDVCERCSQSPPWQFFSGQEYYEHRLPCDATQVGRFRHDRGAGARDGGHHRAGQGHRTSGGQPAA